MERSKDLMLPETGAFMRRLFRDIDRIFDDRALPFFGPRRLTLEDVAWMPTLEMFERNRWLVLRLDLPGLKKEDLTVEVSDTGLTISGERKKEVEEKKDNWFTSERTYGRFYRVIPLPEGIKYGEIMATFTNGVLEVTIPLPEAAVTVPAHKIPIDDRTETKRPAKTAA